MFKVLSHPLARLVAGSVLISFSPVFIKVAGIQPDLSAFYRMFFAAIALSLLLLGRRERIMWDGRAYVLLGLAGGFMSLDLMCWHRSIELVGPGVATLLGNLQVPGIFFLPLGLLCLDSFLSPAVFRDLSRPQCVPG